MNLYEEFSSIIDALTEASIDYAVCGGIAVAIHGYPRFTKDIDLLVLKEDFGRIAAAVYELGYVVPAGPIPFDTGKPTAREIYRISKIEGEETLTLDLLVVNEPLEPVWNDRELIEWQGREVRIVSAPGLAQMKRMAGREKDLLDLQSLGLL